MKVAGDNAQQQHGDARSDVQVRRARHRPEVMRKEAPNSPAHAVVESRGERWCREGNSSSAPLGPVRMQKYKGGREEVLERGKRWSRNAFIAGGRKHP